MAIYRNLYISFWTDTKVEDDFTPEDKFFYLYLLTNPQTNICGCYEISFNQVSQQTGYNKDTIMRLIDRFENVYEVIHYNKETKEILILNWYKYNWSDSDKTLSYVKSATKNIKCDSFRRYVLDVLEKVRTKSNEKVSLKEISENCSEKSEENNTNNEIIKNVVSYLNLVCGTRYMSNSKKTKSCIIARINDGFKEEDFKTVIDKKFKSWNGTKMQEYLRPETLFGNKFEGYLNQEIYEQKNDSYIDKINNRIEDVNRW